MGKGRDISFLVRITFKTITFIIITLLSLSCIKDEKPYFDLTLVPPSFITNQVPLDIRAGIKNNSTSTKQIELEFFIDDEKDERLIHKERFIGMHWAEPAHATRFLEIIRGEQTSDEAFETAADLARRIGKEPSMVEKDVPAFIVNRIGYAMYREALNVLEMGVADVETIDRSVRNALGLWATMCGPFRWMDLTGGPALYGKAIEGVLPSLSNATELPKTMQDLREADAWGIANGRGFYQYTEEEARRWEELFRRHAWTVREVMNEYFPLEEQEE